MARTKNNKILVLFRSVKYLS